ncbi:MAG: MgtC/SapB family protein [Halolamina sp.]
MHALVVQTDAVVAAPLDEPVVRLLIAGALGLFLGLEREWSEKSAGVRTFSLICLSGATATLLAERTSIGSSLLAVGALLVLLLGGLLAVRGLRETEGALSLTTTVSMFVAYSVGALTAAGLVIEGVTVAVLSSVLLVLKRELHSFAGGLAKPEIRSAAEFAVLAFVVYPLLPAGNVSLFGAAFPPRVAWLMVVTVAGIGIANYALVRSYGGKGVAITGFFGGLASSTAVVGSMLDHVRQHASVTEYAVAAVLLADAAMAARNLGIVLFFTLTSDAPTLVGAAIPLGALVAVSVVAAWLTADWDTPMEIGLESPFSMRNALAFGGVFLLILAGSAFAQARFGTLGLYVSAALSGLVSSAGATTSAVLLYIGGGIDAGPAVVAVLLASGSSILVKAGLTVTGPRPFARKVAAWSTVLLLVTAVATVAAMLAGSGAF